MKKLSEEERKKLRDEERKKRQEERRKSSDDGNNNSDDIIKISINGETEGNVTKPRKIVLRPNKQIQINGYTPKVSSSPKPAHGNK